MADFPIRKNPNLPQLNADVLARWQDRRIFERTISERDGAPKWVFYEGPPSANGTPGIHHVIGRALKDLYCRYKTQSGFQVARRAGWDTHGLPVELSVEKALGITKEDIGGKISVAEYNAECRTSVMRYSKEWRTMTERIGYWVDMDRPYVTYESKYIESVWWQLKQIYDRGHLYRGYTVQPFSPMAGTGLSSHELNQPGCYREVSDLSVIAMFRVRPEAQQQAACSATKRTPAAALKDPGFAAALEAGVSFIAWTTTPWTLPSNTALAVNPKFAYSVVETINRYSRDVVRVIVAEGLVQSVFAKPEYVEHAGAGELSWDGSAKKPTPYRVLGSVTGAQLEGLWFEQLLPWVAPLEEPEQAFRVVLGEFVSLEDGTGVVHIAPTFGADDSRVAQAAGVPPMRVKDAEGELVPLVDRRGRFVAQVRELAGKPVKTAYYAKGEEVINVDEEIVVGLKQAGRLFRSLKYKHSYPHCWRTDAPIIYYPMRSWFVRTTAYKQELIRLNQTIKWFPPSTGEGRFGEWLEKLADWNLSRSRFWGIPLPIWTTEDGAEFKCIGSYAELKAEIRRAIEHGAMATDPFKDFEAENFSADNYLKVDVHRPMIDEVKLVSESGKVMTRETDVIDVWFDSGAMPYAQVHYPFENQELVDEGKEFPADFIAEGVDQTRGWFFTLHAIATMNRGAVAFKHVLSNGLVLDAEGRKMSKRLGNAVDPVAMLDKYGADPIRWYMVTNNPPWQNLRFDEGGLEEVVRKFYGTLWSTYSFFATYANVDGFTGAEPGIPVEQRSQLDRWILSELQVTLQTARAQLEAFDATRAYRTVQGFVIDSLSNWYVRLSRRRFWKSEMGRDKLAAYQSVYECLHSVCRVIAPVSPFHADQLYLDLTARCPGEDSVHLTDFPQPKLELIDEPLNEQMRATRRAASLTLSLRKEKNIKVRQPLAKLSVIAHSSLQPALRQMAQVLMDEVNVKELEVAGTDSSVIQRSAQLNFREAGPVFGKQTKLAAEFVKGLGADEISRLGAGESLHFELEGTRMELPPELVKITARGTAGAELATDGDLTVVLDTQLSPALEREGFARSLVSAVQKLRKEADFEVTTRIRLELERQSELEAIVLAHRDYLCSETLCDELKLVEASPAQAIDVDGTSVKMRVSELA